MSMESFYTLKITFHPDPKVEYKKQFSTRKEAQEHIDRSGKDGEYWMIVQELNGAFTLARGYKYQQDTNV